MGIQTTTTVPDIPSGIMTTTTPVGASVGVQQSEPFALVNHARPLTVNEIAMAELVFQDGIDYDKVKVHNEGYLIFGLQDKNTAMTPNGEIYFDESRYLVDFAANSVSNSDKHWFIHEMTHVWQHQLGYWVMLRGAIRIGLNYQYVLESGKKLGDYNMEAQGDLVADYFALKYLQDPYSMNQPQYKDNLKLYEEVLSDFIANPKDTSNLP